MKPAIKSLFAACLLLHLTPAPAAAQGRSVLGIELGSPLRLPKCGAGGGAVTSQPCINNDPVERKGWGADEYHVAIPLAGSPSYVRGELRVAAVGGVVESVQVGTWGIQSQDGVLEALTRQYGKPAHTRQRRQPYSRTPAQFAEWELPDLTVRLHGSTGSIDWGMIEYSTHRYEKLVKDHGERKPPGSAR